MIPRPRAESLLRTCAMGVRVPVTCPTRGRTLFCVAHTRGTSSARARWECACRQLAPHAHVLFFVERTRGEPSPHVRDGSARAGNSPHTWTYSFLRSAHAGNPLCTCTMGVRVPVTRPARARTLFCGAHAHVLIIKQVGDMYSDLDKLKSRVERRRIPISESSYFYSAYFSSSCV